MRARARACAWMRTSSSEGPAAEPRFCSIRESFEAVSWCSRFSIESTAAQPARLRAWREEPGIRPGRARSCPQAKYTRPKRRHEVGGGGPAEVVASSRRAGLADHGCGAAAGRREEGAGKRCAKRSTSEFAARESPSGRRGPRRPRRRRRRRRRRDSCGGCAVAAAAALAVGPRAPRGGCGRRRRWCNGRTIGGRRAARRRQSSAGHARGALAAPLAWRRGGGLSRSSRENGPSEAPRSPRFRTARAILGALFPPSKAPQRDVRATTRRHSAAVCPRDGPATPSPPAR